MSKVSGRKERRQVKSGSPKSLAQNLDLTSTSTSKSPFFSTQQTAVTDMYDDDGEGEEVGSGGLFAEPEGFYQAEKQPTFVTHRTFNGSELNLRLVGSSPLWVGETSRLNLRPLFIQFRCRSRIL